LDMSIQEQKDKLFGRDIYFGVNTDGDTETAPNGDWKIVSGRDALRLSLIRLLLTSPGEWAFKPDYGVGARDYVKRPGSQSAKDELESRIRTQFGRHYGVESVKSVSMEWTSDGSTLKIAVYVQPKGRDIQNQALVIRAEVT